MDVIPAHHRFEPIRFRNEVWDLTHLESFAIRFDPGMGFEVDIVVLFSCHCFSHKPERDSRPREHIPEDEMYDDGRERRVLNEERYRLSREFLPQVVKELPTRKIQVARSEPQNFVTFETTAGSGEATRRYAVFFQVEKDKHRSKRVILRIESAYPMDELSHRLQRAGKVSFGKLVRAAYLAQKIRA